MRGVVKDTKVGRGLKFLPALKKDLNKKLKLILTNVTDVDVDAMRKEVLSYW